MSITLITVAVISFGVHNWRLRRLAKFLVLTALARHICQQSTRVGVGRSSWALNRGSWSYRCQHVIDTLFMKKV